MPRPHNQHSRQPKAGNWQLAPEVCSTLAPYAVSETAQRGVSSNTPPSNRHVHYSGGVDWLDLSCELDWRSDKFSALSKLLYTLSGEAKQNLRRKTLPSFPCELGGEWVLAPSARRSGSHTFKWQIEWRGLTLRLQEVPLPLPGVPNAAVHIPGLWFHTGSLLDGVATTLEAVESLGCTIRTGIVSRIDLCADMAGQSVEPYTAAILRGDYVGRGSKWSPFFSGRRSTGFGIGRAIHLRIYDKVAETESKPEKRALLQRYRWGCMPEHATRVEFQVRREALRGQFNHGDLYDTFSKLAATVEYLTTKWATFRVNPDRENGHQARAPIAPLWERVRESFAWVGKPCAAVEPRGLAICDESQLVAQIQGCLARLLVQDGLSKEVIERAGEGDQAARAELEQRIEAKLVRTLTGREMVAKLLGSHQKLDKSGLLTVHEILRETA